MTVAELQKLLDAINVPKDAYSFSGGLPNECLCLNKTMFTWEVYYSERGKKSGLLTFFSEDEACRNFYFQIKRVFK
jgi:hypothetical protein